MIRTSFKIAIRGFLRNRFFTGFNMLSLTAGLFVAYVAIGYIGFEKSYDSFHENSENIYRLGWTYRSQDYSIIGFENNADENQLNLVNGIKNIPGVKNVAQFITFNTLEFIEWEGKQVQEKGMVTTNTPEEFITLFTWKPIVGSITDFGTDFNKVVLTKTSALKIFGETMGTTSKVIGEAIRIGQENFEIAAIIEDLPLNSHFDFSMVLSQPRIDYWGSRIYVSLADNVNYRNIQDKINKSMGTMNPSVVKDPLYKEHFLQPLEDIHLKSDILYELKAPGNYSFIYLIGGFAAFILMITLFNYANFTLAVKSKQGKSIGVKKAMGAKNSAIAKQFLMEGVLLAVLSLPLLAVLISLIIPFFNELMGVHLKARIWEEPTIAIILLVLAIVLRVLASITPALFLSYKNALSLFKENLKDNRFEHFSIRKYLIISQFVILITITSISYYVLRQMDFIENKDLGFDKEGILFAYTSDEKLNAFQERIRQVPGVYFVGNGSALGIETYNQATYKLKGLDAVFDDANQLYLDMEAVKAYGIETSDVLLNSSGPTTIINRTAAEKFAKLKNIEPEELVGTTVIMEPEYVAEDGQVGFPFSIGGIFEDINLFSLREKVTPYFITLSPNVRMGGRSIISYEADKQKLIMDEILKVYDELNDIQPLEIEFLSQNLAELYTKDKQTVGLIFWMNVIAILLATFGIIGITVFLVMARIKEIGIRRVLGATEFHIVKSTLKEYVWFIAIGLAISWPIAWHASQRWLSNFAYRVDIHQPVFLMVGIATFMGTAVLVGAIAFKAARANPVKSLRTE